MSRAPVDPTPSGPGWTASPTFGVRVAGSAADELEALTGRACASAVAEHLELTDQLRADAAELSDLLHAVIGRLPEGGTKPQLVALRRAVHQLRPPGPRTWSAEVRAALPAEVAGRVEAWLIRRDRVEEVTAGLPALVAEEVGRATDALRKAIAEPAFRFGLVLGSPSLAAAVGGWVDSGTDLRWSSLLRAVKYLARAAAKTSPYASFGFSGLGRWTASATAVEPTADLRWHGVPELDRHSVEGIWSALAVRTELRDHVRVRRNPSATAARGRVRFLAAAAGEPVADAALTDVLRTVWELAGSQPALGQVVGRLEQLTGQPAQRCRGWVDDLLTVGLLEPVRPFRDQDADPLAGLVAWLAASGAPFADAVRAALEDLRAAVAGYPGLPDAPARAQRLQAIRSQLESLSGRLAPRRPSPLPDKELVRENAVVTGPVVTAGAAGWQPVLAHLDVLRRFLAITDPHLAAAAGAAAAFRDRFGAGATVPFLDCYRDLHAVADEPLPARLAELRRTALQTLFDAPRRGDGTVDVDPAEIERLAASWPAPIRAPRSVSCFGQLAGREDDGPRLVVNTVRTGYGWGTSRIHHLLAVHGEDVPPLRPPPASGDVLLAECPAAFGTTLNVRSAAVPHSIRYPGVEAEGGIPLGELVVGHDADRGRLVLRTAEGAEVLPLALGMLVEHLLPPALRYLVRVFGEPQTAFVPHVQLGTVGLGAAVDGVRRRPRLEMGRLVLARAVACVRASALPRRAKGETDAGFLLRFAHWRHRHDLPQRCFVRTLGERRWDKAHKPVYLDSASPLLLDAFDRTVRRLADTDVVAFEEALPELADAPRYGTHGRRVTEYVIEVSGNA